MGNWVAVWASSDSLGGTIGTDDDILTARSTDEGTSWTAPAALDDSTTNDFDPQIATDGAGSWVLTWLAEEPVGGSGTDRDIVSVRSIDDGAT